jgi:hypothetical protein
VNITVLFTSTQLSDDGHSYLPVAADGADSPPLIGQLERTPH